MPQNRRNTSRTSRATLRTKENGLQIALKLRTTLGQLVRKLRTTSGLVDHFERVGEDERLPHDLRVVTHTDRRSGGRERSVVTLKLGVRAVRSREGVRLPFFGRGPRP